MADKVKKRYLFPEDFMADPSVHVFDGKLYIYPSHDWESAAPDDDFGSEYDMKDYHVLSLEGPDPMTSPVKDNGVALDIKDVPWARRQLWDNEVVKGRDGKYYMYFPAKDKTDIFRCGVAVSDSPTGPFKAMPDPIRGSYSIDYAILHDDADDEYYMYFGGIWGGQLQRYADNLAKDNGTSYPADGQPAIPARVVKLAKDMLQFAEEPKPVVILDEDGGRGQRAPLLRGQLDAQVQRQVLLQLLHRRHAQAVLRHRRQPLRPVHLQGRDPHPRLRLDHPPLHCRV